MVGFFSIPPYLESPRKTDKAGRLDIGTWCDLVISSLTYLVVDADISRITCLWPDYTAWQLGFKSGIFRDRKRKLLASLACEPASGQSICSIYKCSHHSSSSWRDTELFLMKKYQRILGLCYKKPIIGVYISLFYFHNDSPPSIEEDIQLTPHLFLVYPPFFFKSFLVSRTEPGTYQVLSKYLMNE